MPLASFPSPGTGVLDLGPIPLRAYAACIILGILVAVWLGDRRWIARGGKPGDVADIAVWAVPFGVVGGRIYHVATSHQLYFGAGRRPIEALYIWQGGLGVWGAIALGAVGAWLGARRRGIRLAPFADAVAPGIALAQGIGRWGNWFNQELFGRPTTLPWAVEIDPDRPDTVAGATTYHPTFLYEFVWCVGIAAVLLWADRRFRLDRGRVFALYVALYTVGRAWIEALRIDDAHRVLGVRLNDWTSLALCTAAVAYLVLSRRTSTAAAADSTPIDAPADRDSPARA